MGWFRTLVSAAVIGFGHVGVVRAQTLSELLSESARRRVSVHGVIGVQSEAYSTTGEQRRPGLSGLTNANLTISALGLSTTLDLLLSTEESQFRQSLNQVAFESRWRFVTASVGNPMPEMGEFLLSGTTLTGLWVRLEPGPLHLAAASGRSRRAVDGITGGGAIEELESQPSFERWMTGVRAGVGSETGSFFHVASLSSRDALASIANPGTVRPEENLATSVISGLSLFRGALRTRVEGTISAMNADRQATRIDTDAWLDADSTDLPAVALPVARLITSLFTPTVSSRVSYALETESQVSVARQALRLRFREVGPGFEVHGVPYVREDRREWSAQPSLQLASGRLRLRTTITSGRDNLLGTRAATQHRDDVSVDLQAVPLERLTLSGAFSDSRNDNRTTIDDGVSSNRQTLRRVRLSPTLRLGSLRSTHSLSAALGTQSFATAQGTDRTNSASLNWTGPLAGALQGSAGLSAVMTDARTVRSDVWSATAGVSRVSRTSPLSGGVSVSATRVTTEVTILEALRTTTLDRIGLSVNAAWALSARDQVRAMVVGSVNRSSTVDYRDVRVVLALTRRISGD